MEKQDTQEYIINLLKNTKREGIEGIIHYLEVSDFFTAPASTRYHGCWKGGLAEHSANVYDAIRFLYLNLKESDDLILPDITEESLIIVSILHDLCKINCYKLGTRNVKDEVTGQWSQVPDYKRNPKLPLGHGGKSIFLIQQFIKLTVDEALAIFWHMGAHDLSNYNTVNEMGQAYESSLLSFLLHQADMTATYIMENNNYNS